MILKKGDDIPIIEAKGALSTTANPTLGTNRLYTSKSKLPQLSRDWLSRDYDRYLKIIEKESPEAFSEMRRILFDGKSYKTAVVFAADNPNIQFSKGIDDFMGRILADPKIESFDLLKILPGD